MKNLKYSLLMGLIFTHFSVSAMSLDEFLVEVKKRNKEFQSLDVSTEAAEDRREAGDIGLSPVLTMSGGYLSDEAQPQTLGTKLKSEQYSVGVAKEFSTGTLASISANVQHNEIDNVPAGYPAYLSDYHAGSLGISLRQSLWKNAFGSGTRLRQQREATAATLEKQSYNLQQRQILFEAESAYWAYLLQLDESKAREESLERSKRIETWLKRRYSDGIADKADYLNAQALTASRDLLLASTRDQLVAAEKNIRLFLEMDDKEKLPALTSDVKKARDIRGLVGATNGKVVRLDAYLAALEAKTRNLGAQEVRDALKPDLVLEGAYNTNSNIQDSSTEALNKINNLDIPTAKLGLKFVYMFDTDAKVSQESLARKEALSAQLKSERKMLESEYSWGELQRRYDEMLKQITTAERITQLNISRAKEQSLKLSRGRAITSDVITAEEDASTSILTLNRLRAEARKMEAQSRLFVPLNE
ncbi:TolC family protein [Bdellovibrio sp. HCB337]|uniref:TolC family protein n=1 Tax=Bdellovibrio sp. HCB337 TaxID=3394358 RepID=UPI0039A58A2F